MRTSSASHVLIGSPELGAILPEQIDSSAESIRVLIRKHLPHGTKAEVAKLARIAPDQLSRQLSGTEGIQARAVMASLRFLPETVAAAIITILCGATPDFEERTALIVHFRASRQLFLPGLR